MQTQQPLPFDLPCRPELFPASTGSDKAREWIDRAHSVCMFFRAKQTAIKAMLATGRITTADRTEQPFSRLKNGKIPA
jgi:organic hydroperoxide reductase OsmC/OhrA